VGSSPLKNKHMETIQKLLEIACILGSIVLVIIVTMVAVIYKAYKDIDDETSKTDIDI